MDDDYEEGTASSIAHRIMLKSGVPVRTMGLEARTAGFYPDVDNLPPNPQKIIKFIRNLKDEEPFKE